MRVLHFFKIFPPDSFGGIEQVIHTLASGGRTHGIDTRVAVLSPRGQRSERADGYEIHRYARTFELASTGFSWRFFSGFSEEARWADILHFHFPWPFIDLCYAASSVRKPTVLTYHSDVVNQTRLLKLYRPLRDHFLNRMDRIIATSPNYVESSDVLQAHRSKTSVIPIGMPALARAYRPGAWKDKLGDRYFVFLGALRYYKGLHTLLAALQGRDYPLAIVGDGPEGVRLKAQARSLGLQRTIFLGALNDDEKHEILAGACGFVYPSHLRSEAFGIALIEASQHGLPMISCEIGTGTTFVNIHEHTGLAIPPENPLLLGQALDRLWHSPSQARTWGENARQRYEQEFTATKMVDRYSHCYSELVG